MYKTLFGTFVEQVFSLQVHFDTKNNGPMKHLSLSSNIQFLTNTFPKCDAMSQCYIPALFFLILTQRKSISFFLHCIQLKMSYVFLADLYHSHYDSHYDYDFLGVLGVIIFAISGTKLAKINITK